MKRVTIELSDGQFALLQSVAGDTRRICNLLDWTIEEEARYRLIGALRRAAVADEVAPSRVIEAEAAA